MRLNRVMLFVNDLHKMAGFYGAMPGVSPVAETRTDTWVEFETEGAGFALHAIPSEFAKDIEILDPATPRETTPIKVIFEVEDVAAERARLEALGVSIIERPWGSCGGVDPEGNIFQICRGRTASARS